MSHAQLSAPFRYAPLDYADARDERSVETTSAPMLRVRPAFVAKAMLGAVLTLVVLGSISRYVQTVLPADAYGGLREICFRFDLDRENTVPAWYSSIGLFACGSLLGLIASFTHQRGGRYVGHWGLLAVTFLYISLDESASLHEILIQPMRRILDTGGLLYFAWVIPAAAIVCVYGLLFVKFLLYLPRRTGRLFLLAGLTYVGGAMGVELIGGALAEADGLLSLRYTIAMTIEETMEMLGVVLFLYALLDYLGAHFNGWSTRVAA